MKQFNFFWLDGSTSIGTGNNVQEAFTNAGFDSGAVRAIKDKEDKL